MEMKRWFALIFVLAIISSIAVFAAACEAAEEDVPEDTPVSEESSVSEDGSDEPMAGVVMPKPEGATQVDIILAEWSIVPSPRTVPAGQIYFLVENIGPIDPHEVVIVKTDLAPGELPVVDGKVDESAVEVIGEVEEFASGTSASGVFDLEAGNYLLICNITEIEEGELESHFEEGMVVAFTVTESEDEPMAGVVLPKPEGATQVDIILAEWSIVPSPRTVPAGETYFLVENIGPIDPHEVVIVKTDLAPGELPVVDGKVDESAVEVIGEVEEFASGTSASGVFDLEPGNYLLICNITEIEEGELESHFEEGMVVAFTVTEAEDEPMAGVVLPKPAGATQVDIILAEWSIVPSPRTVPAGETYFLVENIGPIDPHEVVIVKTDLAPGELPVVDGKVDESAVEVIGEVEEFASGTSASGVFDLEAGNYLLICNITEIEEGELESHFEEGMVVAFTVQ